MRNLINLLSTNRFNICFSIICIDLCVSSSSTKVFEITKYTQLPHEALDCFEKTHATDLVHTLWFPILEGLHFNPAILGNSVHVQNVQKYRIGYISDEMGWHGYFVWNPTCWDLLCRPVPTISAARADVTGRVVLDCSCHEYSSLGATLYFLLTSDLRF